MEVSVIIPVYNAENFIEKAVQSALEQKQTKEIILIEDGSPDNSLDKCIELENNNPKVKLYTHKNNENKGASASRNLGIEKAQFPFIAFLDADDYYLPGFFDKAEEIFKIHSNAEGVFGSIGAYFYDKKSRIKHFKRLGQEKTGLSIDYNPNTDNLFNIFQKPNIGYFSIISLIIKKHVIAKIDDFDTELIQAQDTDFIWRLAYFCKLYGIDKDDIVAMRGVHSGNRVLNDKKQKYYNNVFLKKWIRNISKFKIPFNSAFVIYRKYLAQHRIITKYEKIGFIRIPLKIIISIKLFFQNPYLLYLFISGLWKSIKKVD